MTLEVSERTNFLYNSEKCSNFLLTDIQPIFGVSLGLAVERSRCHDSVKLPLVVRDCIDYLQEHGLSSEQIYKMEGVKTRLQNLKKCYNNRESHGEEFDVPTACSLLKSYLAELSEPVLTTELTTRFEEASALPDVAQQALQLESLIDQLPKCNQVLLSWLFRHFSDVINNEKNNKLNAQSLAVLLSPVLQMSHRLMITVLCHAETLFADIELNK
jgi:RalA-binding protein 1